MDNAALRQILAVNDGSLPDINFDFRGARVVADAYDRVQRRAASLKSVGATYWSTVEKRDCIIEFGSNPAVLVLRSEVEAFHVVFTGLTSSKGVSIPDLGVFVLGEDNIAFDYRMGPEWSDEAIEGLFELMSEVAGLADNTLVTHEGNWFDPDGTILVDAFYTWRNSRPG